MDEVTMTGPLFEGSEKIMEAFVKEVEVETGKFINDALHKSFSIFKNPTGYYESRVSEEPAGSDEVVTDHGVVYGSWLEKGGQGFPGYHLFEEATALANKRVVSIAEGLLSRKYLERLGG